MFNSNYVKFLFSDGTRNVRITRHFRPYVYKCEAEGQPRPDIAWVMMRRPHDKAEIISTHALFNVTSLVRHLDDVTLKCLASNVVAGVRYTRTAQLTPPGAFLGCDKR